MYTAIHCSKCLFVHQCIRPQCLAIIATLLSLQMIAQLTAVVVAQRRAVEEVWGDRGQWQFHGHPVCSRSMQLVGNVCFYGDSIVLKWVLICVFLCYQKKVYTMSCIRESVDSLSRDGADTPMPPYIGKAFTRTNFEDLSLFRYLTIVYESLCTQ